LPLEVLAEVSRTIDEHNFACADPLQQHDCALLVAAALAALVTPAAEAADAGASPSCLRGGAAL
jgi:hypothetical protein